MDAKKLIGGLLAGTAIGIAIGVLLAPSSGDETRRKIADGSMKLKDELLDTVDNSLHSLKSKFNSGTDEASKRAKETINTANERIKV